MTICWFGIYNPNFGRNKIYIQALKKAGHIIIECRDNSHGLIKYFYLWKKHQGIKNDYDVMVIGYPGHVVVPFAKLISKKKVIADLLGSIYDAEISSHRSSLWKKIETRLADFMAVKFADKILLESEAQKKFFTKKFEKSDKYEVVYTGADEKLSQKSVRPKSVADKFAVLFRGKLTPESGIMHILKAAEILENNKNIFFRIIGSGYLLDQVKKFLHQHDLPNLELISQYLPDDELITIMKDANLMLGQFGNNPRLNRTIPHKAFEAFALGIPYLTGDGLAIREIVKDGASAFFVPLADSQALAAKIKFLSTQSELLEQVTVCAGNIFKEKFASEPLVERLVKVML